MHASVAGGTAAATGAVIAAASAGATCCRTSSRNCSRCSVCSWCLRLPSRPRFMPAKMCQPAAERLLQLGHWLLLFCHLNFGSAELPGFCIATVCMASASILLGSNATGLAAAGVRLCWRRRAAAVATRNRNQQLAQLCLHAYCHCLQRGRAFM
jgi:hypothetical protein